MRDLDATLTSMFCKIWSRWNHELKLNSFGTIIWLSRSTKKRVFLYLTHVCTCNWYLLKELLNLTLISISSLTTKSYKIIMLVILLTYESLMWVIYANDLFWGSVYSCDYLWPTRGLLDKFQTFTNNRKNTRISVDTQSQGPQICPKIWSHKPMKKPSCTKYNRQCVSPWTIHKATKKS